MRRLGALAGALQLVAAGAQRGQLGRQPLVLLPDAPRAPAAPGPRCRRPRRALDSSSSRARAAASASLSSANGARSSPAPAAGASGAGRGVLDQDHRRRPARPPASPAAAPPPQWRTIPPERRASSAQIGKPLATWSRLLSIDHGALSTLLGLALVMRQAEPLADLTADHRALLPARQVKCRGRSSIAR